MSRGDSKSNRPSVDGLPRVGEDRLVELGGVLRKRYAEVQIEPIPERLQRVIDELKALEKKRATDD